MNCKRFYRLIFFLFFSGFSLQGLMAGPVFQNPGIADSEYFEITDYINKETGYVIAKVSITLKTRNGEKYYHLLVREGNLFLNDIEVRYHDLTTITEKRYDSRTGTLIELFSFDGVSRVRLYNREKKLDKYFTVSDGNIYSRYAYLVSFRGFPFNGASSAVFKSYMFEYGDAMAMKLSRIARQSVTVRAGTFDCYKLELTVTGWLSIFVKGKFNLYFEAAPPHRFVKYEEMDDKGNWDANELVKYKK